ncbi:MAG: FtsQ-type POTRA domain-containing protein [Bdellovibrionia bacterium]
MSPVKARNIVFLLVTLTALAGFGLNQLRRSSIFFIQSIDVVWLDTNIGLISQGIDENEVKRRIEVPLGKIGLFDFSVQEAEKNLLSHEWIRGVKVKRRFPSSLEVLVALRMPKALIQTSKDTLRYLDQEGVIFGHPDLKSIANLPVFFGFLGHPSETRQAITFLDHWELSLLAKSSGISSVYYDSERGFRILVSYPFKIDEKNRLPSTRVVDNKFRTMIDLGQEIDGKVDQKLAALSSVVKYLSEHSMPVRQIWAEVDKKIVVKTVHGS